MVQMKEELKALLENLEELYIPHGSDERINKLLKNINSKAFISHMVQMKAPNMYQEININYTFISHMVQMKVLP